MSGIGRADSTHPADDAARRHRHWIFALEHLENGVTEQIIRSMKVVLLDIDAWAHDIEEGVAHGLAHLVLKHHRRKGGLTHRDEQDVEGLAALWLDEAEGAALFTRVNSI